MAANGPTTGGSTQTLTGLNFGLTDSSLSMSIGATPCTTSSWVSVTSLRCEQPAGTGAAEAVTVSTNSNLMFGTLLSAFTYDGAPGSVSVVTITLPCSHQDAVFVYVLDFYSSLQRRRPSPTSPTSPPSHTNTHNAHPRARVHTHEHTRTCARARTQAMQLHPRPRRPRPHRLHQRRPRPQVPPSPRLASPRLASPYMLCVCVCVCARARMRT
jgi:hypothetical protein